jgi:hypothetical protein
MGVDRCPHFARHHRAGLEVGRLHGAPQPLGREVGEAPIEGLVAGEAVAADQRRQQGLLIVAQVIGTARAAPGERQPEQGEGQRRDAPLGAMEMRLQPEGLRVGRELGQPNEIGRLRCGGGRR